MYIIITAIVVVVVLYRLFMGWNFTSEPLFLKNRDYERDNFKGYHKAWYFLMSSMELKTNEVKTIYMCEQEIVLFRGSSGKVFALSAYCCHLGANIGIGGKVTQNEGKDCISCPFHGWVFDGSNGKCVKIPNIESNNIPTNARIATWPVIEQEHMIYVWYDREGGEPTYKVEKLNEIYHKNYDMKHPYMSEEMVFYNDIKWMIENAFDQEHFPHIHATMFGVLKVKTSIEPVTTKMDDKNIYSIKHVHHMSLLGLIDVAKVVIDVCITSPLIAQATFTVYSPLLDVSILEVSQCLPVSPLKSQHKFYLFFQSDSIPTRLFGQLFLNSLHIVFQQDTIIWWNLKLPKQPVLTKMDKLLADYRLWAKQRSK